MHEKTGDIWQLIGIANAICITTNGIVKDNGALVMGAGIAKEALDMFPGIQFKLGEIVRKYGNIPAICGIKNGTRIVSFPTKNDFKDPSDIFLIKKSAQMIARITTDQNWGYVAIPRPGCGCGKLEWDDVKKILNPIFDNRFTIYSK